MKGLKVLAVAISMPWLVSLSPWWESRSPLFADDDFLRGDCNSSGELELTDSVLLLAYLADLGPEVIWHFDSADLNDDGFLTMEDAFWIQRYIFLLGPPPMPPFPDPGQDPTPDTITQTSVAPPPEPAPNAHYALSLHQEVASPTQEIAFRLRIEYGDLSAAKATVVYGAVRFDPDVLRFEEIENLVGDPEDCQAVDFGGGEVGVAVYRGARPEDEIPEGDVARLTFTAAAISPSPADPKPQAALEYTVGKENLHYYTGVGFYAPLEGSDIDPPPLVPTFAVSLRGGERLFVRGDANGDTQVDVSDPVLMLSYFAGQNPSVSHYDAMDATDDGYLTFEDVVWLLRFVLLVGPPPPPPYPEPGFDPTDDTIEWDKVAPPPEPPQDARYKVWLYWADSPETPPGETVAMRLRVLYREDTADVPPPNQVYAAIRYTPQVLKVEEVKPLLGEDWEVVFVEFSDTAVDPPAPTGQLGIGLICRKCAQAPQPVPSDKDAVEVTFIVQPTLTPIAAQAELAYTVGRENLHYYTGVGVLAPSPEGPAVPVPKFIVTQRETGSRFIRGDANGFNEDEINVDISDAVYILGYLFLGSVAAPRCLDALDANDKDLVDLSDAVYLLNFLFLGGPAPPPPFGDSCEACGLDPTRDTLDCKFYKPCYCK